MNMISKLVVVGLLAQAHAAFAILPFAPVRKQIYTDAKREGALKGLQHPSMQLSYSKDRRTVTARLYSLGTWPNKQVRVPVEQATFKLQQLIDGTLVRPVTTNGKIWQPVIRRF